MYRDEDDLQLLAELAGVLDQTTTPGSQACTWSCASWSPTPAPTPSPIWRSGLGRAGRGRRAVRAPGRRRARRGAPNGVQATAGGEPDRAAALEERANEAMLAT